MILASTFEEAVGTLFVVGISGIALGILMWKCGGNGDLGRIVLPRFLAVMIIITVLSGGVWCYLNFMML